MLEDLAKCFDSVRKGLGDMADEFKKEFDAAVLGVEAAVRKAEDHLHEESYFKVLTNDSSYLDAVCRIMSRKATAGELDFIALHFEHEADSLTKVFESLGADDAGNAKVLRAKRSVARKITEAAAKQSKELKERWNSQR